MLTLSNHIRIIWGVPDEDLFARLPRAFQPAKQALRDGLVLGHCDPYPLAFGLDQMVARGQGLASLSALVKAFPNSAATAQVRLPLEAAPDLDQIDQIERAHAQNRLDQLAARRPGKKKQHGGTGDLFPATR